MQSVTVRLVTDSYEQQHMPVSGTVLLRDKHVARRAFWMLTPFALLLLLAGIAVALGADPAAPRLAAAIPFGALLGVLWIMFTKISIRSVLTTDELSVHWGFSVVRIPVKSITSSEVVRLGATALPVARLGAESWASNGSVLVRWRNEAGKEMQHAFAANDPAAVVAMIESVRTGTGSNVRVVSGHAAASSETDNVQEVGRERERNASN